MRLLLSIIVIFLSVLSVEARSLVKLRVDSTGIYELSHAELRALGFDDPSKVKVLGYGADCLSNHDLATAPDGLPQMMSAHLADKLVFFAAGAVTAMFEAADAKSGGWVMKRRRNPASDSGFCFLSDSETDAPCVVTRVPAPAAGAVSAADTHLSYRFVEEERLNPAGGGTRFFSHNLLSEQAPVYRFNLVDRADNEVGIQTVAGICNMSVTTGNYLRGVVLNAGAEILGSGATESAGRSRTIYEKFRTGRNLTVVSSKDSLLTLTVGYPNDVRNDNWDFAGLDHITVAYRRNNRLPSAGALDMVLLASREQHDVRLNGADESTQVWETDGSSIVRTYDVDSLGCFSLAETDGTLRVFAFNPAAEQLHPSVVDVDVSLANLRSMATPDMLIVASRVMRPYAEELAALHRRFQNLEVEVVEQGDVFNEFSSGTPHVMAVRRFVHSLELRNPGKLKGLLLYGPATVDQRLKLDDDYLYVIVSENEDEAGSAQPPSSTLLATSGNNDITKSFATDTYFVRVGSPTASSLSATSPYFRVMYSPMAMTVGRVPASSVAEAMAYNRKALHYFENPPVVAAYNNAVFASGFASRSEDMHMIDAEAAVSQAVESRGHSLTVRRAAHNLFGKNADDSRRLFDFIGAALRSGVDYFAYYGHGSHNGPTGTWLAENAAKTRYDSALPLGFFASCHVAAFDHHSGCFYGSMLFNDCGGVMAMAASAREVYQTLNATFGKHFAAAHFNRPADAPLGYAYMTAQNKVSAAADRELMCNSLDYPFLGDPMLPSYGAERTIEINAPDTLTPNAKNGFSGCIRKPDGSIDTGFNGVVKIAVYESAYIAENLAPALSGSQSQRPSTIEKAEMDCELMAEIVGTVSGGRFSVVGYLPHPVRNAGLHRVSAYAYTADASVRASGTAGVIPMGQPAAIVSPVMPGPSIAHVSVDEFNGSELRVTASVRSTVGLPVGRAFDSPLKMVVDGRTLPDAASGLIATGQGEYRLSYVMNRPSDGVHDLRLTVTDRLRNQTSHETEFEVSTPMVCGLEVAMSDSETLFTCGRSSLDAVVIIENHVGDKLLEIKLDAAGRAVWNHRLPDGRLAPAGHYRAYAKVPEVTGLWWSRPVNIAVNKQSE